MEGPGHVPLVRSPKSGTGFCNTSSSAVSCAHWSTPNMAMPSLMLMAPATT